MNQALVLGCLVDYKFIWMLFHKLRVIHMFLV